MSTLHLKQTTTATPERFVAGLTDFGPRPRPPRTVRRSPVTLWTRVHQDRSCPANLTRCGPGNPAPENGLPQTSRPRAEDYGWITTAVAVR